MKRNADWRRRRMCLVACVLVAVVAGCGAPERAARPARPPKAARPAAYQPPKPASNSPEAEGDRESDDHRPSKWRKKLKARYA